MDLWTFAILFGIAFTVFITALFVYLQRIAANRIRKAAAKEEISKTNINLKLKVPNHPSHKSIVQELDGLTPFQVLLTIFIVGTGFLYLYHQWITPEILTKQIAVEKSLVPEETENQAVAEQSDQEPANSKPEKSQKLSKGQKTKSDVPLVQKQWKSLKTPDFAKLQSFIPELKNFQFVFVYDRADESMQIGKQSPLIKSLDAWKAWSSHYQFKTEHCDWKSLSQCSTPSDKISAKKIFIVLPGNWNFNQLEKLITQGELIVLFGMPYQIYDKKRDHPVRFKHLTFERFNKDVQNWLVVKGEQALTLGLDAGLRLNVPPLQTNYRVLSKTPNAVGIGSTGYAAPVRLDIIQDPKARVVWLDFLPEVRGVTEVLQASVFRYLLKRKHWSFANWPNKVSVTSVLFIESTKPAQDIPSARKELEKIGLGEFPISWIVDDKSLKSEVTVTQKDSFFCKLSFASTESISQAVSDVKDCRQNIKKNANSEVVGVVTNESPSNNLPYNALFNNNLNILVTRTNAHSPMPYVKKADQEYILVLPTSYNTLLSLDPKSVDKHFRIARNSGSISQILVPADQFLKNLKTFKILVDSIQSLQGKFLSASELVEWRVAREKLLSGFPVAASVSSKYGPFSVRVDEESSLLAQGLDGVPDTNRMPASTVETNDEK